VTRLTARFVTWQTGGAVDHAQPSGPRADA
jgi:hypothetical protein